MDEDEPKEVVARTYIGFRVGLRTFAQVFTPPEDVEARHKALDNLESMAYTLLDVVRGLQAPGPVDSDGVEYADEERMQAINRSLDEFHKMAKELILDLSKADKGGPILVLPRKGK